MSSVNLAIGNGLARITLDRPPLNVLTIAMLHDLAAALRRAAATRDARVIRLDAAGKAFSAGVDVGEHMGDDLPRMMDGLHDVFGAFEATPQPVIALVQGAALTSGFIFRSQGTVCENARKDHIPGCRHFVRFVCEGPEVFLHLLMLHEPWMHFKRDIAYGVPLRNRIGLFLCIRKVEENPLRFE